MNKLDLEGYLEDARNPQIARDAEKLPPPRIGRGRGNMTFEQYLDWLTEMSKLSPPRKPKPFPKKLRIELK